MAVRYTRSLRGTNSKSTVSYASASSSLTTTRQQKTTRLLTFGAYCATTFLKRGIKHHPSSETLSDGCHLVSLVRPTNRSKDVTHPGRVTCFGLDAIVITKQLVSQENGVRSYAIGLKIGLEPANVPHGES
jgi:hypothetical protein